VAVLLRTRRLLLRPWRDEDVVAYGQLEADPAVMEYLLPRPDWAARARAHWQEHGFGQWVVEIPDEASFIGALGLNIISYPAHFTPAVEMAWRMAPAHWGQGYATEAARAALDYGFDKLGLTEIVATTVQANWRSRRVMERLGMTYAPEDDFDHPRVPAGLLKRHVLYRRRRPGAGVS
jgi:RimJ/RimL family protein N-acetyltransferase